MSQELGGRSDKFGNEFERLWVVAVALRILDGQATSIRWEPLGKQGDGIELRLTLLDGSVEVHQCKIENKYHGNWSIGALAKAGIAKAMWAQLGRDDVDRFVLVSRDPCRVLGDLCHRACHCNDDPRAFLADSLSSAKHRSEFEELCKRWSLNPTRPDDVHVALRYLRRIGFERGFWEPGERLLIERQARGFASGDVKSIVDSLARFLSESLGNEVSASELRTHLRSDGHPPWDLPGDLTAAAVEELQRQFCESQNRVFADGRLIPRSQTNEIWNLLTEGKGPRLILVHGRAGHGKSGVLLELANRLAQESIPFLPIRLDSQRPDGGNGFVQDVLGLPGPPAKCLSAISGKKLAVLIVDQLDAVRWTAAHSEAAWQICRGIIDLALACDTIRVVVACRTFDLEDDQRFKAWEAELAVHAGSVPTSKRVEVSLLRPKDVRQFVAEHNGQYEHFTNRQQELLRIPLCLYLWWTLRNDSLLPDTFSTASDLMGVFWHARRRTLTAERGISEFQLSECLDKIVDYLDRTGRQDFPAALVAPYPNVVAAAESLNLMQVPARGTLKFAHQSYLDYLVAERVVRQCTVTGQSPLEWIRNSEQSLFRREQLRLLLVLLREQIPDEYLCLLQQLLWDSGVRFHLRHLALSILRDVTTPTDGEYSLLVKLLGDEFWRPHALRVVILGHSGWFGRCASEGLFDNWLASSDEKQINDAIWMFRAAPTDQRHAVDGALAPYATSGDSTWANRIDATLSPDICDDSDTSFEWRRKRVRAGHLRTDGYSLSVMAKRCPERAILLLEAFFDHRLNTIEGRCRAAGDADIADMDELRSEAIAEISREAHRTGRNAWQLLLGAMQRCILLTRRVRKERIRQAKKMNPTALFMPTDSLWRLYGKLRNLNGAAMRVLTRMGRKLIRADYQSVWDDLSTLDLGWSRALNRLTCEVLKAAPTEKADDVMLWLLGDPRRFAVGSQRTGVPERPACALVAKFGRHCTDDTFRKLEAAVLRYHRPEENLSVENQLQILREQGLLLSNHYGRGQYMLLAAMPQDQITSRARSALATWRSKFGEPAKSERDVRAQVEFAGSTIPHDRIHLVSDANWLQIIATGWASQRRVRPPGRSFAVRSHQMFARDIGEQTKMNPTRFVRLAMQIPIHAPIDYFEAILRGIHQCAAPKKLPDEFPPWEPASFEEIQGFIERLIDGGVESTELTDAICWVVRNRAAERWDLRIMDYIADACINASTPRAEPHERVDRELSPWEGTRGVAVESLQSLVSNHAGLELRYLSELLQIAEDPDASVRVAATGLCMAVLRRNPDWAVQLFLQVCDHDDHRVLAGRYVPYFLRYTWSRYATELEPLLCRMVNCSDDDVAELGSYWAAVGHAAKGLYSTLAIACRSGTVPQRIGWARALVDLTKTDEWRQRAVEQLSAFFDDPDDVVSGKAAIVFHQNPGLFQHPLGVVVANGLADSRAFERDPSDLAMPLRQLQGSILQYGPTVVKMVMRATGKMAPLISDIRTRYALVSEAIPELLLRLYQEAEGPEHTELRYCCLNAWDKLLESQIVSHDQLRRIDW